MGKLIQLFLYFPICKKEFIALFYRLVAKWNVFMYANPQWNCIFFLLFFFSNKVRISLQVKSGRNKFAEKKRRILQKTEVRVTVGDLIYVGQDGKLHLGIVYLRVYAFFGHGEFNWFVFS